MNTTIVACMYFLVGVWFDVLVMHTIVVLVVLLWIARCTASPGDIISAIRQASVPLDSFALTTTKPHKTDKSHMHTISCLTLGRNRRSQCPL